MPVTCAPPSGSVFELDATTTVTCTAIDQAGNTGDAVFGITVSDTTVPTISLPSDITAEATSASGAAVAFAPSASDVVDGTVVVTCTPDSGSMYPLGTTTVDCSAEDAHGNATGGSFDVTVVDTTAPTLTLPANIIREATGPAGATATFITDADDTVAGTLAVTCDATSGSIFPLATTTVHCSATDDAGNTTSGSFTVTVRDTAAPVVTVPANVNLTATGANGAPATYAATASDLVTGPIAPACTPASGSTFLPGTTTVTCTATDGAGNVASKTFTVTVTFDVAGGLLPPVNPNPAVRNTVKGGSTVPVKWQVRNPEGGFISNLNIVAGFSITKLSCSSMAPVADPVEITTTGGTVLRYAGDQFIQNWQTPKSPGSCYRLTVTLTDGTALSSELRTEVAR